jgi:hypothetical protein
MEHVPLPGSEFVRRGFREGLATYFLESHLFEDRSSEGFTDQQQQRWEAVNGHPELIRRLPDRAGVRIEHNPLVPIFDLSLRESTYFDVGGQVTVLEKTRTAADPAEPAAADGPVTNHDAVAWWPLGAPIVLTAVLTGLASLLGVPIWAVLGLGVAAVMVAAPPGRWLVSAAFVARAPGRRSLRSVGSLDQLIALPPPTEGEPRPLERIIGQIDEHFRDDVITRNIASAYEPVNWQRPWTIWFMRVADGTIVVNLATLPFAPTRIQRWMYKVARTQYRLSHLRLEMRTVSHVVTLAIPRSVRLMLSYLLDAASFFWFTPSHREARIAIRGELLKGEPLIFVDRLGLGRSVHLTKARERMLPLRPQRRVCLGSGDGANAHSRV